MNLSIELYGKNYLRSATMWNQYTMELMSWWALFAVTLGVGLSLADDDDSTTPNEPETDPRLEPFELYDDFDAGDYEALRIGTENNDELIAAPETPTAFNGDAGNDVIRGSNEDDYILGGDGRDAIRAEEGDDVIRGGAGEDQIIARGGDDTIYGEADADLINGSVGDDFVSGGDGNDLMIGWLGADTLTGDAGDDTLSGFRTNASAPDAGKVEAADSLDGGEGNDRLWLSNGDTGTGGTGGDEFLADWRSDDKLDSVTLTDFNRNDDQITVLVNPPAEGEEMPEVTQEISGDGADRLVYLNGDEIMRVVGAGEGDDLKIATMTEPPSGPVNLDENTAPVT